MLIADDEKVIMAKAGDFSIYTSLSRILSFIKIFWSFKIEWFAIICYGYNFY